MPSVNSGAYVAGLKEFRSELRRLEGEWPRALGKVHKQIGESGATRARAYAAGMGGVQARAASAIKGRGTATQARIAVSGGRSVPMANVAFWGAKKHTGWYNRARYVDGVPQHPKWIGNSWDAATNPGGPYAINAALAAYLPELLDEYEEAIQDLARRAFPS